MTDHSVAIALFTRDLRTRDNPVLSAAAASRHVVPLFVRDTAIHRGSFSGSARQAFLDGCLADLDRQLRRLGAGLLITSGNIVDEVCRVAAQVGAGTIHIAADVSRYATARERRLTEALASQRRSLIVHDTVHTIQPAGSLTPTGGDHYSVFTPYHRAWSATPWRDVLETPERLSLPSALSWDPVEAAERPDWAAGESGAREQANSFFHDRLAGYADLHDALADDATSRLSPYLHFGCLSALELARQARRQPSKGSEAFIRQLAWRDFHAQVLAAKPDAAWEDYRDRKDRWREDPEALDAWRDGRTGFPIIDAGMRQLQAENWMHNRARLIVASFLTKTLYVDWRAGAAHFLQHLLDGDLANNNLNWQWVAGTGTDTRPNRVLNPIRQAQRFDPDGDYVRRWVPELADLDPTDIHRPWLLATPPKNYPAPIVDLAEGRQRFLDARS